MILLVHRQGRIICFFQLESYRERLMCGRYYVDDETAREIEKLIRQVDQKLQQDEGLGKAGK